MLLVLPLLPQLHPPLPLLPPQPPALLLQAADNPPRFLKGLCVIDDIAYFGVAPSASRAARADAGLACELAAYDLKEGLLLWRRVVPSRGLVNLVAAPHLVVESTAYSINLAPQVSYRGSEAYARALAAARAAADGGAGGSSSIASTDGAAVGAATTGHGGGTVREQLQQQQEAQAQQGVAAASRAIAGARRALSEVEALPEEDPLAAFPLRLDSVRWSSGLPRLYLGLAQQQQRQQQQRQQQQEGVTAEPTTTTGSGTSSTGSVSVSSSSSGGGDPSRQSGLQLLLLRLEMGPLRAAVLALPDEAWSGAWQRRENAFLEGREGNLQQVEVGGGGQVSPPHAKGREGKGGPLQQECVWGESTSTRGQGGVHRQEGQEGQAAAGGVHRVGCQGENATGRAAGTLLLA